MNTRHPLSARIPPGFRPARVEAKAAIRAGLQRVDANPHGFCDKDGKRLVTVVGLQVGDVIYRQMRGKLVALKVIALNPFSVGPK